MLGKSVALRLIRGRPDELSAESYAVRMRTGLLTSVCGFRRFISHTLTGNDSVDRFSIRMQYGAGAMARAPQLPVVKQKKKKR